MGKNAILELNNKGYHYFEDEAAENAYIDALVYNDAPPEFWTKDKVERANKTILISEAELNELSNIAWYQMHVLTNQAMKMLALTVKPWLNINYNVYLLGNRLTAKKIKGLVMAISIYDGDETKVKLSFGNTIFIGEVERTINNTMVKREQLTINRKEKLYGVARMLFDSFFTAAEVGGYDVYFDNTLDGNCRLFFAFEHNGGRHGELYLGFHKALITIN